MRDSVGRGHEWPFLVLDPELRYNINPKARGAHWYNCGRTVMG